MPPVMWQTALWYDDDDDDDDDIKYKIDDFFIWKLHCL
jgi:hypothetical protein